MEKHLRCLSSQAFPPVRPDGVVPAGTGFVPIQPNVLPLLFGDLHPGLVLARHQDRLDTKARLRFRVPEVAQHGFYRPQWLACPVDADEAEQSMLHWVPLRRSARVMA